MDKDGQRRSETDRADKDVQGRTVNGLKRIKKDRSAESDRDEQRLTKTQRQTEPDRADSDGPCRVGTDRDRHIWINSDVCRHIWTGTYRFS